MAKLQGKRGLIVGIANGHSLAYGCARAFRDEGAELAITYLNGKAEPHVRPLAAALGCPLTAHCDVTADAELASLSRPIPPTCARLASPLPSTARSPA